MQRRAFLKTALLPLSTAVVPDSEPSCLSDGELGLQDLQTVRGYLQYAIPDYIDDDWGISELEEQVSETVGLICYAYGEANDAIESVSFESGFLSQLPAYDLEGLEDNEDFYDWLIEEFADISSFVAEMDIFPDGLAAELEQFDPNLREYTEYIPFAWSLKKMLDTGCTIHRRLEDEREVDIPTYISFCKYAGLFLIECLLLLVGSSAPYRVAFKATGAVNRAIIKHVGQNIGWRLYSRLLSGIHWCIRIIFSESMDQGISAAVNKAAAAVVADIREVDGMKAVSERCVRRTVEYQVGEIVHYQGELTDWDYQRWKGQQLADRRMAQLQNFEFKFEISLPF